MEKQLGWACKLGGMEPLRISSVGPSVSQLHGVSNMAPACWLCVCEVSVQKRDSGLLTLMPDTSVPPCKPLVPIKMLPQCWSSEGVILNTFLWGFFKRNCLELWKFYQLNPHWFLQPEVVRT